MKYLIVFFLSLKDVVVSSSFNENDEKFPDFVYNILHCL